jgi:hypothetical protein
MTKRNRRPLIGVAFESELTNLEGNVAYYIDTLEWYGRRRFSKLIKEGRSIAAELETDSEDAGQFAYEWMSECDDALSEYARSVERHDYVYFGPENGAVGFWYSVDSALEDADLKVDAGDEVPVGFSGLAAFVTDHGNVSLYRYSRGRGIELFSAV